MCLQGCDQSEFMFRAGTGKDVDFQHGRAERRIVKFFQIRTGQYLVGVFQADLPADGRCRGGVIAGDHLDLNAGAVAFSHRGDGFRSRRIDHPDDAEQNQLAFQVGPFQYRVVREHRLCRQREHALPLGRDVFGLLTPVSRVQRCPVAGTVCFFPAHGKHALGGAFYKNAGVLLMIVMQRRHELVSGIERNDVGACPAPALVVAVHAGLAAKGQ